MKTLNASDLTVNKDGLLAFRDTGEAVPETVKKINGILDLSGTPLQKLPDALEEVDGGLNLRGTAMGYLPDGLKRVNGILNLPGGMTTLPASICDSGCKVMQGGKYLTRHQIQNMRASAHGLSQIVSIFENGVIAASDLTVNEDGLLAFRATGEAVPETVKKINGILDLSGTPLQKLPDALEEVDGDLDVSDTPLKKLPDGLKKVNGDLKIPQSMRYLPDSVRDGSINVIQNGKQLSLSDLNGMRLSIFRDNLQKGIVYASDLTVNEDGLLAFRHTGEAVPETVQIIHGNLDVSDTPLKKLPDGLKVFNGDLVASRTPLKKLPDGLKVFNGDLVLDGCDQLETLPDGLKKVNGNLKIPQSMRYLPDSVRDGSINVIQNGKQLSLSDLNGMRLSIFRDNLQKGIVYASDLTVNEDGLLAFRHTGEAVPETVQIIHGNLDVSDTPLKKLPDGLKVFNGDLVASRTPLKKLPNWLSKVKGNLDVSDTPLRTLPFRLSEVEGDLVLDGCNQLETLPDALKSVRDHLFIPVSVKSLPARICDSGCKVVQQGEYLTPDKIQRMRGTDFEIRDKIDAPVHPDDNRDKSRNARPQHAKRLLANADEVISPSYDRRVSPQVHIGDLYEGYRPEFVPINVVAEMVKEGSEGVRKTFTLPDDIRYSDKEEVVRTDRVHEAIYNGQLTPKPVVGGFTARLNSAAGLSSSWKRDDRSDEGYRRQ